MDYISLSSNNNLIHTLLFINRAYKTKTFVEFIMVNQMEFSESTKFVRKLLQKIFDKNYFFVIENKILDIPSKIKFIIKIINDNDDTVLNMKSFELFEINDIEMEQNIINQNNDNIKDDFVFENTFQTLNIDKINYNFMNTDYFLFDLSIIKELKLHNSKDYSKLIYEIIKRFPKIKIILIIDDSINSIEKKDLKLNKRLIDLSDIIFAFRNKLNNFYKIYNLTINKNSKEKYNKQNYINTYLKEEFLEIIGNQKSRNYDLIIDDQDKCRKNISRLTVLFEEFNSITIYNQQGIQMKIDYIETFPLTTINTKNMHKIEYLYSYSEKFTHIFIAGFLSRIIHEKPLRVCVGAGDLLMKKSLFLFMNNIDYINDIDQFNVLVPNLKKNSKRKKIEKIIKEYNELASKENKFILDCTNIIKCQKKEYNPLLDKNCASYLLKNQNIKHLKRFGFINKNGVILEDPDNIRKKGKKSDIINNTIKRRMLTDTNFFLRNNKLPSNRNTYYTINTNYDNPDNKKTPLFKSVFNTIFDKQNDNKLGAFSPNIRTKFNLPNMSKTYCNFSGQESKNLNTNLNHNLNLRKSKSMYSRNNNNIIISKRNQSLNNKKYNNKLLIQIIKTKQPKTNYFPKIINKILSQK